jgi:4'-phosphopantetheinyl transferase
MPLHYHTSWPDGNTILMVWRIVESEDWFMERIPDALSFAHPRRHLHHLAGRFLLSQADPSFPYAALRLTEHGRPFLEDGSRHFSITHSADMAAVIVSQDLGVGVDLEFISRRVLKVAPRFLGISERAWLAEAGLTDPVSGLPEGHLAVDICTLLWSAKEAAYKWLGIPGLDFAACLEIEPFTPVASGEMKTRCRKDGELSFRIGYQRVGEAWLTWIAEPLDLHRPGQRLPSAG